MFPDPLQTTLPWLTRRSPSSVVLAPLRLTLPEEATVSSPVPASVPPSQLSAPVRRVCVLFTLSVAPANRRFPEPDRENTFRPVTVTVTGPLTDRALASDRADAVTSARSVPALRVSGPL